LTSPGFGVKEGEEYSRGEGFAGIGVNVGQPNRPERGMGVFKEKRRISSLEKGIKG